MSTLVQIGTPLGAIILAANEDAAPLSAGAFLAVADNYGGGMSFWRSARMYQDDGTLLLDIVQGGVTDSSGFAPVAHEPTTRTGLRHVTGAVALARFEPGTAVGAAFYICLDDAPLLDAGSPGDDDPGYAVFGRIVDGLEVVRAIQGLPCSEDAPMEVLKGQILRDPVPITMMRRLDCA